MKKFKKPASDPGTYKCTALFYNVDPDTGDYLGCAGAVVTVTVLE